MVKIKNETLRAIGLLLLLEKGWGQSLGKKSRFVLFGLFSYLSFGWFVNAKNIDGEQLDKMFLQFFSSIEGFLAGMLAVLVMLFGLYLSLIAASLGQSLLVGGK